MDTRRVPVVSRRDLWDQEPIDKPPLNTPLSHVIQMIGAFGHKFVYLFHYQKKKQ